MADHECPFPICSRRVPFHMFACGPHWYALSTELRSKIWRAWRSGSAEEHAELLVEAMRVYEAMVAAKPEATP